MDLLLHIGCEKTGTTSVQNWLHAHDEALRARGIFYARSLGRPNNRRITFYGLEPGTPDDGLRRDGILTAEQHAEYQIRIAADLNAELEHASAAGCRTFVISNEHCHSRLKTEATVRKVHDLLAPWFPTMNVHCFLRPQIDLALSLASTYSRNGGVVSRQWLETETRANNPYYAFDDLLGRWARVFGRHNIFPIPFKRVPDSVEYFERLLNVTDLALPRRPGANTAIDYRVIALINGMAQGQDAPPDYQYVVRLFLNELPVEQRLTLDRASAQRIQARFEEGNDATCRDWPTIEAADLSPVWEAYPETGNIDRLEMAHEVGPFVRRILDRMRLENALEKARRFAMTSEREMTKGRLDAALRATREGLGFAREAVTVPAYRKPIEPIIARLEHRQKKVLSMGGGQVLEPKVSAHDDSSGQQDSGGFDTAPNDD
jgi:hypothetical protein